jgi:RNA-binding protein
LRPSVHVGRHGVTEAVLSGTAEALEANELVKIRFGQGFEGDVDATAAEFARQLGAVVAGRVGRTALMYRERAVEPEIRLPDATGR